LTATPRLQAPTRPHRVSSLTALSAIATVLLGPALLGDTITVFGPKTYKRGHGEPVWVKDTFTVSNTSLQYTLRVKNGGDGQFDEVKDATVKLNGQVVLDEDDFEHSHNALIQKTVTLAASNEIAVRVTGKPGSGFILDIFGTVTDSTPPTITAAVSPAPNAAGWNNTNVTVSFTCADAGSGVATCPGPVTVTSETAGQVVTGTATDRAGNHANASVTVKLDKTPPTISANSAPPPNADGWNNTDVTVSFACSDGLSGVGAGCPGSVTVSSEGVGQVVSRSVSDAAGNSASASVTLKIDKTAPAITASIHPPPNGAGWNNTEVTVSFNCTGGLVNCPAPVALSAEGAGQVVSGTATDPAGNAATASVTVNIDKTPPVVHAAPNPAPNALGWHNGDVAVDFLCDDSLSGVALCPPQHVVGSEGAGQVVTDAAADVAGNTASASLTLNIDRTPPTLSASPVPPPNAAGWNNSDVTVSFGASDALSGVDEVSPPALISDEGTERAAFGSATDRAGNMATLTYTTNLDKTPPTVAITAPEQGLVRRVPNVTVSGTADDASGIVAVRVNGIDAGAGSPWSLDVPLQSEGPQPVTAEAEDVAGNLGTASVGVVLGIPPAIHITSPADLTAVGAMPITVAGTVDDPQATIRVGIEGVPAVVSGSSFTASGVSLREGGNVVTATATDTLGNASSDSITVVLDTTAPRVLIDAPQAGSVTTDESVVVTGRINDVVMGTVNSGQAQVSVNGVTAQVANRTFIAQGIPLQLGNNTITATATDAVGNSDSQTVTVIRANVPGPHVRVVSGDAQSAGIGELLSQPLVVALTDGANVPLPGRSVVFRVAENNGELLAADGHSARGLALLTGADGTASARFTLGSRAGVGNNRVEASAPGVVGAAVFTASGALAAADKISLDSGNSQIGVVGQPLPRPFVAVVTDAGHNRLGGVPVTFQVVEGDGSLAGQSESTVLSDGDGRALAVLTLGTHGGIENNVVAARALGVPDQAASFVASAREPGDPQDTAVSGVVLDNSNQPVPGVTLRVRGTALAVPSDAQGQFRVAHVPVGDVHLQVDGSTAQRPGTWPNLDFELVTVAGIDNTLGMPVYLLPLDTSNSIFVDETHGGTLTLPEIPGFSLTVAPNSATFPDGTRHGTVSVTPVHVDKVPMVPNFGQQPRFIVTIQPPGVKFDPPAAVTHPNVDGLKPGEVTELYSFDHDAGSFVATGTATISEDGTVLRSDPGMGILKGGWHCGGNPAGAGTPHNCPECKKCDGTNCVNDDGGGCDDHDECTSADGKHQGPDKCQGGSCQGKKIDFEEHDAGFSEDVKVPEDIVAKVDSFLHKIPGLDAIHLDEVKAGVEGKVKDCCEKGKGFIPSGIKEVAGTFEMKAKVKGLTLYGPPTISKEFDVGFGIIDLDLELGAKVDADFTFSAKGGPRQDLCKEKDCLFGEIKGGTNVTAKITAKAIVCVETFWSSRSCGSIEVTPVSFSAPISLSVTKNIPECDSGVKGHFSFGKLKFKLSFGFGITDPPKPTSGGAEFEGFKISYPPPSISYEKTILDGFTIDF
jgi:hypothetical protein